MSRTSVTALFVLLALLVAGGSSAAAAPALTAKAKPKAAACRKSTSKARSRSKAKRCVVKHKKAAVKPKTPVAALPEAVNAPAPTVIGTPLTVSVNPGSNVTLDLGSGRIRTFPLSGTLQGYIPGAYDSQTDTTGELNRGQLAVGAVDTLTDACPFPALGRTNPATTVIPDPGRTSPIVLHPNGDVELTTNVIIRTVLDIRSPAGCGAPSITTGYADTIGSVRTGGHTDTGLGSVDVGSNYFPLRLRVCWTPGDPSQPCAFAPTGLLAVGSVRLNVSVAIG